MTKLGTLIVIALLVVLGTGAYFALRSPESVIPPGNNGGDATTTPTQNALIRVDSPLPNAVVTSPVTVSGEARGNWYFEASFPIKLLDANGRLLAQAPAQAQGEWMTTEFVPFRLSLPFATSTTATGILVLEKDNPSGLPENAAEVRIPVRFGETAQASVRAVKLYFYNENKDRDASGNILCSAQGLVPAERSILLTNTPIQDAVKELLKGPTPAERLQAPNTEFPLSGVTLTGAALSNTVLTLSFADPQNKTGGGSCRVQILRAQIEATAKQFGGVTTVRFSPDWLFQP
ncbi:MAG: hypothetical protein UY54_C0021G0003 [Parcubacteria group bacterium GW2011_GWA2_50_10b]|nr:MAG: hypothetical protein UY54_C0021G0003 [Parcubacteria group bacterium GW2011_GWA2_50_10b]